MTDDVEGFTVAQLSAVAALNATFTAKMVFAERKLLPFASRLGERDK